MEKYYNVQNAIRNAEQIRGNEPYNPFMTDNYVGDYVKAESEDEAIMLAMDYIIEVLKNDPCADYEIQEDDDSILVRENGEPVIEYYNFIATKV